MDSQPATATVGGLVPRVTGISQAGVGVPQQIQTQDVAVGLILSVLPRVSPDGLILMQVGVENSNVGDPNAGIPIGFGLGGEVIRSPIINQTRAETVVSAYSGQTVVFAGLISKTRASTRRQIPLLGSIPWIGAAFRFDSETENRKELLVVLTPRIVQTDEDYEVLKQVESSRMSWCLADVLNIHGDTGLSGGNGLWGPARGQVLYPECPRHPFLIGHFTTWITTIRAAGAGALLSTRPDQRLLRSAGPTSKPPGRVRRLATSILFRPKLIDSAAEACSSVPSPARPAGGTVRRVSAAGGQPLVATKGFQRPLIYGSPTDWIRRQGENS